MEKAKNAPVVLELNAHEKRAMDMRYLRRYVGFLEENVAETVERLAAQLRRQAEAVENTGKGIFDTETNFGTPERRVETIVHDVTWMMPNLVTEQLARQVREWRHYANELKALEALEAAENEYSG